MNRRQFLLFLLLVILVIFIIFQRQLITHLKIALFITEQFPQIPLKPLGLLTSNPEHKKVELETNNGKVVADLYMSQDKAAALILAMGVKTSEDDKPILLHFADTMARLGYVTFWPRLKTLDKGESLPEEPETFIESFKYLKSLKEVDPKRISFAGFSVGSSTAFVAATDPQIKDLVHGLVFFGGYFDVFDYLESLASQSMVSFDRRVLWIPHKDAINHAKSLLEKREALGVRTIFEAQNLADIQTRLAETSAREIDGLKKYSPKEKLTDFKTKVFILHDKSDNFVPYVESIKLNQAVKKQVGDFVITNLFEHVQPNRPINIEELVKLYGFLYKTLSFL